MATVAKLGLRVKYIGTVGDDERGRVQIESLRETGIDLDDVEIRENCPNQTAYIIIDQSTGERTVFWSRPDCLRLDPESITLEKIAVRADAAHRRARYAGRGESRELARGNGHSGDAWMSIRFITASIACCASVDYLVASSEFPGAVDHGARSVPRARDDSERIQDEVSRR